MAQVPEEVELEQSFAEGEVYDDGSDEESEMGVGGGQNFGFQPARVATAERREVVQPKSPLYEEKRKAINRLLCRHPQLKLRSSKATLKELDKYDEEELDNILTNATNDLASIRGAPMADFLINTVASLVDLFLIPGYAARCRADVELRQDVEAEASLLLGSSSNRTNIAFRMLNNAHVQLTTPEAPQAYGIPVPQAHVPEVVPQYFETVQPQEPPQQNVFSEETRAAGQ